MTRKCCVPSCKSNYESVSVKGQAAVTTFSFPKDEETKKKWLRAIPRKNWQPTKYSSVCIKHFNENDVILDQIYKNGSTVTTLLLAHPKLKEDAVPTIFQNLPVYLSSTSTVVRRKDPEVRRKALQSKEAGKIEEFVKSDIINDFTNFLDTFQTKLNGINSETKWNFKIKSNFGVWLYLLNIECSNSSSESETELSAAEILCSVLVKSDLTLKLFIGKEEISAHDLNWILPCDLKLSRWSQLENILVRYANVSQHNLRTRSFEFFLQKSYENLVTCNEKAEEMEDYQHKKQLELLIDQLNMILLKRRKYSPATILFAFMAYSYSSSCYMLLQDHLLLPSKRYLQQISSRFNVKPDKNLSNTSHYLKQISKNLTVREKYTILQIDEIYVKSKLDFKANGIVGSSENNAKDLAKTIETFMISSAFGNFSEVIRLVPVNNTTGDQLKILVNEVIEFVQKCGFPIVAILTDNNRINQNMFTLISSNESMPNPCFPDINTYLSYDTVHIFKNVRNNWLNKKDTFHTLIYPDFENYTIKRYACFEHLRLFFKDEQNKLIKKAYKLSYKTLYPSNLERQNVLLVDNVFHMSTIAALQTEEKCTDTANFLQIFRIWWDIVNSKNPIVGKIKRNEWAGPVCSIEDEKLLFLKRFLSWIEAWQSFKDKAGLSSDTFEAIRRASQVLCKIANDALTKFNVSYVLLGKFQTDKLEKRLGMYRSNYNVSVRQVIESENKLRIRHILKMINKKEACFSNFANESTESNLYNVDIDQFRPIITSNYLELCEIEESSCIYVCGYGARSVCKKLECTACVFLFEEGRGSNVCNEYFDFLQRGGLSVPSYHVKCVFFHMYALLEYIVANSVWETKFLQSSCQKGILIQLTQLSLNSNNFF